ncbi:hypothetical protein [Leptolyngbya ohadii]|uniref:hypothetical protein n=1 Tax=Leptolyngbya ohadii TaxID=1962290 RepID=UPI000B5A15AF|nr:hypothetical protein [Leptolyngbya ohadii]
MILAAGATLQSGKYVIQAVLHQTDLGTTFQAYHVYLDQKVVLQTLNPYMGGKVARSNFPQLRQQFVEKAQQLAKYPSNHRLRAIDLFEEKIDGQDLPFVVMSLFPNQPPQKIGEWFAILPEPAAKQEDIAETIAIPAEFSQIPLAEPEKEQSADKLAQVTVAPSTVAKPTVAKPTVARSQPQEATLQQVLAAANGKSAADGKPPASGSSPVSSPVKPLEQGNGAKEGTAAPAPQTSTANGASTAAVSPIDALPSQSRSGHSVRVLVQPKKRSPNLFLLTALIAGAAGAGMGFALRVHPAPKGKMPFNLNTGLFNREQSFPAQGNWPVRETPADLMPQPAATQPSYSSEPALQYTPPIVLLTCPLNLLPLPSYVLLFPRALTSNLGTLRVPASCLFRLCALPARKLVLGK